MVKQTAVLLLMGLLLAGCGKAGVRTAVVEPTAVPTVAMQEYRSEFMKVTVDVPIDWKYKSGYTSAEFISPDNETILLSRNSTNRETIEGVLEDVEYYKSPRVTFEEKSIIHTLPYVVRIEHFDTGPIDEQKVYYFYNNYQIYFLSTSAPELYDELDQVAQSFEYWGE